MAFENLQARMQGIFKQLRSKGRLTEKDVKEAMREVKLALLEADVNFKVVKSFINSVSEKAVGKNVLEGLNPGQQVIKIVHEQLIELLGTSQSKITFSQRAQTVYMMVGLQGSGKTTSCAKLAASLRRQGNRPLLVACDIYRPAAVKQLQVMGRNLGIPVFEMSTNKSPTDIALAAIASAAKQSEDIVIIDTAGRLHIDEEMMDELCEMKTAVKPQEILLVVDAMTGQDAVNVADRFNASLGVDGVIITKLDGDARGGATLSVRTVTGKPIKYVGLGEKVEDFEPFYPERMASRILGMGDVLSLVEKAQEAFDEKQAAEFEKKIRNNEFDLEDFLVQMQQVKKIGSIKDILGMIPGMSSINMEDAVIDEKKMVYVEAIIQSMTKAERRNPGILNGSRKKRIALGSGQSIQDVNRLLKQFEDMRKMMKHFTTEMSRGKKGKINMPF